MADGKKIEIKIAASGGDQAAAEIRKVSDAASDASNPANQKGFGGMLDGVPERAEEVTQSLEELRAAAASAKSEFAGLDESATEVSDTLEEVGNKAADVGKPSTIGRAKEIAGAVGAIGIAAGIAAKTFGQVRDAFDSIDLEKLRAIDQAMADQVETAGRLANALQDPIGALLELTTGESVASAFAGMNDQISRVAQQHEEAIDRLIAKGITQRDELQDMAAAIRDANAILDAKDGADAKARDRADAQAIRGGAAPEDVAARRAQDDAAKAIEKINRDLDAKAAAVQAAFDNSEQAKGNAANVANNPNAKSEDLARANEAAKQLQEEFEEQRRQFETAKKIAAEARRGVREEAAGKVEGFTGDKSDREAREKKQADDKAARQKQIDDAKARRDAQQAERAEIAAKESALKDSSQGAAAKIFGSRTAGKNTTARGVATALENGTNEDEIAKLTRMVNEKSGSMGAAMTQALREVLAGLEKQSGEISVLRSQIKTNRTGQ
jgi:hypothetical protein